MSHYVSMADRQSPVDCRMLQLELEFYQLTQSQLNNLSLICFNEVLNILDNQAYCDWCWDGLHEQKHVKAERIKSNICNSESGYQWGGTGDIISDVVWDSKSFKQYQKRLDSQLLRLDQFSWLPMDYKDCFNELLKKSAGEKELKAAILEMFNLYGKSPIGKWRNHDFVVSFCGNGYKNFDSFYGKFVFSIALPCVKSCVIEFAEQLSNIACKASEAVVNVSGRVTLSPIYPIGFCSGHMRYFGNLNGEPIKTPDGYEPIEWYPYYYLCGAEWFNLLSPLQQQHLPQLNSNSSQFPNVSLKELSSGGYVVCCKKSILQTDITELRGVKEILYRALYPGYSEILFEHLWDSNACSFNTKPRIQWEYVPIYEDEVFVLSDRVRFQHKTC